MEQRAGLGTLEILVARASKEFQGYPEPLVTRDQPAKQDHQDQSDHLDHRANLDILEPPAILETPDSVAHRGLLDLRVTREHRDKQDLLEIPEFRESKGHRVLPGRQVNREARER